MKCSPGGKGLLAGLSIHHAQLSDCPLIEEMSASFASQDLLVPRTLGEIAENVHEFLVVRSGTTVTGCVGLTPRHDELLMYNLCISSGDQGKGIGRALVERAAGIGSQLGFSALLASSKHAGDWFVRQGFSEVAPLEETEDWRNRFTQRRGSSIYRRVLALG
ncbi:GNAT family N-acetyltransferase [Streptomyces sp. NBC_01387]|uniref:GNAT family N-acetyltransferase n=1 Tax=unclassified Streptomyces TaxID=2593676 RepID=UPI0020253331|nr:MULTISPECIES: GNAT family N-acetyltransferase [unclassified Streptomyces]MCX4551227.1 GNAT family N-acetyltransferase [Streptomyces sp. NBC_01500]WSC22623.1 GNAT family N-acetyltransferase [Streptomyces sp. NBC_01766]WSV56466.1 GNAT family N-acetyltransferase [Streptomyces sp. NBC_01014]